jgi:hypothetical protein
MYLQPAEWSNAGIARATGPRSIGSILGAMPEVAALRAAKDGRLRNLALRRNSA